MTRPAFRPQVLVVRLAAAALAVALAACAPVERGAGPRLYHGAAMAAESEVQAQAGNPDRVGAQSGSAGMPEAPPATRHAGPALLEDRIIAADGALLPLRRWLPEGPPQAVLLALHGFADYSIAFADVGPHLAARGIAVYAYDQRGFGAAPHAGYWAGTATLRLDLATAATLLRQEHPDPPLIVLGESMGGAVVITALGGAPLAGAEPPRAQEQSGGDSGSDSGNDSGERPFFEDFDLDFDLGDLHIQRPSEVGPGVAGPAPVDREAAGWPLTMPEVDAAVLVAPAVRGRQLLSPLEQAVLWTLSHTVPWWPVRPGALPVDVIPSDNLEMLLARGRDPLVPQVFRLDLAWGLTLVMSEALAAAPHLSATPTLLLYGLRDDLVPADAVATFLDSLPDSAPVTVALYPDNYHMLLRDLSAEPILAAWVLDPAAPLPSGADRVPVEALQDREALAEARGRGSADPSPDPSPAPSLGPSPGPSPGHFPGP